METTKGSAVIFGASGGIGSELLRTLSERGHPVVAASRERVASSSDSVFPVTYSSCDSESVKNVFSSAVDRFGAVTSVASCIGSLLLRPAHLIKDEEWDETLFIHATTSFYILREAVQHLPSGGSIVFVSSGAASIGMPNHEAIAAAKGAIEGLVKAAAATYAAKRIRVNAVAPGLTRTPLTERIVENENALKQSLAFHPFGRVGEPADIASAMRWLMSEEASWVTGEVIHVDGGLSQLKSARG